MSIPVFNPQRANGGNYYPDEGMAVTPNATIIKTQFNDGYTQIAGAGINNLLRTYNPHWTNAYKVEADAILAFLEARQGWQKFFWTPQGETLQRCFTCQTWNYAKKSGGYVDLDATFNEIPPL